MRKKGLRRGDKVGISHDLSDNFPIMPKGTMLDTETEILDIESKRIKVWIYYKFKTTIEVKGPIWIPLKAVKKKVS